MIRKGTTVRLRRGRRVGSARVLARLTDVEGGLFLDRPLDGFRYWNIEDVKRSEQALPKEKR